MYKFSIFVFFILLSGCSVQQYENNRLAELLEVQSPQVILNELQKSQPIERDKTQFQLNLGFLQFINGEFQNAITTLTLAKQEMAVLEATSITENIGAGSISETLRSYSGYPTDKVMVHNILALSYLFSGDIYGARVEMLQSELVMKKLSQLDSRIDELASANLLAGIVYEILDERSNALISYRDAAQSIKNQDKPLPIGLKQALLRMSFKLGIKDQYAAYQHQFPELQLPEKKSKTQVFVLYFNGVVNHKIQQSVMVPSSNLAQLIRISMPAYPPQRLNNGYAQVIQGESQVVSEVVENIDDLARKDLAEEYASILLLTTSRAIIKYQLVNAAQKQNPLLGALANMTTVLSENADLRSWNMLPSNIQFGYVEPINEHILIGHNQGTLNKIVIAKGSKNVILVNSLSNTAFHYQQ